MATYVGGRSASRDETPPPPPPPRGHHQRLVPTSMNPQPADPRVWVSGDFLACVLVIYLEDDFLSLTIIVWVRQKDMHTPCCSVRFPCQQKRPPTCLMCVSAFNSGRKEAGAKLAPIFAG